MDVKFFKYMLRITSLPMFKMRLKNNKDYKKLILNSNHFDKHYYLKEYCDARLSSLAASDHYCEYGLKENRRPNSSFDPKWYEEYYADVKNNGAYPFIHYILFGEKENRFCNERERSEYEAIKNSGSFSEVFYRNTYDDLKYLDDSFDYLLHYVRYGKSEGRVLRGECDTTQNTVLSSGGNAPPYEAVQGFHLPELISDEATKDEYEAIQKSGLFDAGYYAITYPDVKLSGIHPLEHFCLHGWKEQRNPNGSFNTKYYLEKYPDIADSGINPFAHWVMYGRAEQRKINIVEVDDTLDLSSPNPSIIFVSHEASQTGAPAVLLTLMRWIKNNTDINFSIVIGAKGPLNARFEKIAPCLYVDDYHQHELRNELREFCGNHVQVVYVNTIASGFYAGHLDFLNAEFITHVHEMESVFKLFAPQFEVLKKLCKKFIVVSEGSFEAVKKRTDTKVTELRLLKPFIDAKQATLGGFSRPHNKYFIFGCGAVETRKGFDLFCDVASELLSEGFTDFKMYWIGSADNKDLNPHSEIDARNLHNHVEWLGVKDYPREYFEWGDIFLLPSREDPYPLVCMEAAECNMPVICFDEQAGGMHSFVEQDAGMVVPYLNISAMASAVLELLKNDSERKKKGARAFEKVKERHYVDVIAPQIVELFPAIINSKSNTELESYKELIDASKIISFDIFDTLITRKLSDPNVVFDVVEHKHTHNQTAAVPFFNERMETAGKVLGGYQGRVDDISIDEIYESMSFYNNSELEKEIEIQMCIPHPLGLELYKYALEKGKKIFIASDMYLDQGTVEAILRKCNISHWDELFLSSSIGKKKDTGKLYKYILSVAKKDKISASDILHIGDNWEGDVYKAKLSGLKALRFKPLYEKSHNLFPLIEKSKGRLSQIGKIWESFSTQAVRLWHETHPILANDFYTKLGFELSGPLAAMMAMHAKAQSEKLGATKIVFMARDGRIIKKAFDVLYREEILSGTFDPCYLHLSRATVISATFDHPLSSNDIYFLIEGLHLAQKPVSYFISKAGLDSNDKKITKIVKRYFNSVDVIPSWSDLNILSKIFSDLSERIYECNKDKRDALELYLHKHGILLEDKVLVVDVGWLLNIQSRLVKFINSLQCKTKLHGCYVGSRDRINKSLSHSSLLFDSGDPYIYAKLIEENTTLFEVLFSASEASANTLKICEQAGGEDVIVEMKELLTPLPEEFVIAQKIQMGAEAYFECFKEARDCFFPEQVSKDYFFYIFEALVKTDNEKAKAMLGQFEVRLGGHHEFIAYEDLVKNDNNYEYKLKSQDEYFDPILYEANASLKKVLIVTSAGLDNGSTRYRAINLANSLKIQNISSILIHAATDIQKAEKIITESDIVVFQRCFIEQGNVGAFLTKARQSKKLCIAEIDDLVFPEYIPTIGSVTGGEWGFDEAMKVATSYESMIKNVDACIVSTPILKKYIEESYNLEAVIVRNKVNLSQLREPVEKPYDQIRLIYSSGTYSHKEDFSIIESLLYDFLCEHENVSLSVLGAAQVSGRILGLPNVSNYPLLEYNNMLDFVAKHDLMLVPLADNVFNCAKSSVKFVECAAVGVPVLASNVGEFNYSIRHHDNGLLATNSNEWAQALDAIVKNPEQLSILASKAHEAVKEYFMTHMLERDVKDLLMGKKNA